jgi:hypothetical protein
MIQIARLPAAAAERGSGLPFEATSRRRERLADATARTQWVGKDA